jgi:hypothetical protein
LLAAASVVFPDPFVSKIKETEIKYYTLAGFALLFAGLLYFILDLRSRFGFLSWDPVRKNIGTRLLDLLPELTPEQANYLGAERRIMDVFYRLIDSDNTLKVKMGLVMFNGLVVTSCHDLVAVGILGTMAHAAALIITRDEAHAWWCLGLFVGVFVAYGFARRAMARHRELSDDQIEFIADHQRNKLREFAKEALQGMPPNGPAGS